MSLLRNKTWILALAPITGVLFFGAALGYFYRGVYTPPPANLVAYKDAMPQPFEVRRHPVTPVQRKGLLLVDNAHATSYDENEISDLLSRVADRGYSIEFLGDRTLPPFRADERLALIKEKLPRADTFAVILPRVDCKRAELDIVNEFVRKGGRLLLIGDPGRPHDINALAEEFGILFQQGSLYNLVEHDLNYRNVLVRDFSPDAVTEGLSEVVFYTAGGVKSSGAQLAFTDENTYSTMVERIEPFSPIVRSDDGRILALGDFTFMLPPNNTTLDNDRLISNIADFLTSSDRRFDLADFPYLFRDEVDILLGDASLFEVGSSMKSLLGVNNVASQIRGVEDVTRDTVFLGLYEHGSSVAQYLALAGVQIEDEILTPFTPDIDRAGTSLVLLHETQGRKVLVVLAESRGDLGEVIGLLETGEFRGGLVSDNLGVYQVSAAEPPSEEANPE